MKFHRSASRRWRSPSSSCPQSWPGGSGPGTNGSRAGGVRRTASCSSRSRQVIPRKPTTSCMRNRRCRRGVVYPHDQLGQRGPDGSIRAAIDANLDSASKSLIGGGPRRPRPVPARPGGGGSTRGRPGCGPAPLPRGRLPALPARRDEPGRGRACTLLSAPLPAGHVPERACRRLRNCAARPAPGLGGRSGRGQNGDEVADPADEVLVCRVELPGDGGVQAAPGARA